MFRKLSVSQFFLFSKKEEEGEEKRQHTKEKQSQVIGYPILGGKLSFISSFFLTQVETKASEVPVRFLRL